MIRKDFAYCTNCKKYTTQSFIHEGELVIKSGDSITQRFCCDVCKTNNERTLQKCWKCNKHTSQELIEETPSENMEETVSQMYKCKICDEIIKPIDDRIRIYTDLSMLKMKKVGFIANSVCVIKNKF